MMRPFDLSAPLPAGTTVLEASAGTGKTYAIAALAARFVAEGRADVGQLLLVTFSRAATAELRSRVRERLQASARALAATASAGVEPADPVDRLLAAAAASEVAARAARLADAVDRFDRATIMTTHEFCHGMLRGLGVLAPQEPQSALIEDARGLADEAAADVYLRRYAFDERFPPFGFADGREGDDPGARSIARDAVEVQAEIGPTDADGVVAERVAFAAEVRLEVTERLRRRRLYTFDEQLTRLRDALLDPVTGERARAKLAARFPVVLVDEFQDTDPVQWQVLQAAFGEGTGATLVLIGDPKQAIYSFRGADVHTYTAAARAAAARTTLTRNHRADAAVVDAVGRLFSGVLLGDGIDVPPVDAARPDRRLVGAEDGPWAAGVQLRVVPGEEPLSAWQAGERIAADLVGVVAQLLGAEAPLRPRDGGGLRASDLAVLVRTNRRGAELARALGAAGVPATFSGTHSVFASPAATDWLTLLTALDARRRPYVQRAVLTDFVGGTLSGLADAGDEQWARWSVWLHGWGRALRAGGVPALWAAVEADTDLTARLLAHDLGERAVTDHRHLAELLHARGGPGPTAHDLAGWLRRQIAEATTAAERTRRLETDEHAVQIMTVHRAKGLQFPVVLLPEACRDWLDERDSGRRVVLPLPDGRALDVGGRLGAGREQRWMSHRVDEADESLRGLYVAMTRAQSQVIAWWALHPDTASSPLHRLLHAEHSSPPRRPALAYDPDALPRGGSPLHLPWLAGAGVAVVEASHPGAPGGSVASGAGGGLRARPWTRAIDQEWRRTSYSGLTAEAHEAPDPDAAPLSDEPPVGDAGIEPDPALALPSPMAPLPGGAAFGSLVHAVYETLDARGAGWRDDLRAEVERRLRAWPLPGVDAAALAAGLAPTLETPLGPLAAGTTLRSFGPADRLTELDFEFPLDAPASTLADVARLLAEHLPPGDPLADYPAALAGPALSRQRLHGFLTGSIDAVLRLPDGRFLIVDYKTNRLDSPGAPPEGLTVGHYTRAAMARAMIASHYPLQALLYAVALHRFLRGRLAGYEPERHLAGAAYLFVRGMAGPGTPVVDGHPTGVYSWRPPTGLVLAVSALLAGGRP